MVVYNIPVIETMAHRDGDKDPKLSKIEEAVAQANHEVTQFLRNPDVINTAHTDRRHVLQSLVLDPVVAAVDLKNNMDKRPVARQLLYSLKEYASSENFKPETAVNIEMIDKIFNN